MSKIQYEWSVHVTGLCWKQPLLYNINKFTLNILEFSPDFRNKTIEIE